MPAPSFRNIEGPTDVEGHQASVLGDLAIFAADLVPDQHVMDPASVANC